MIPKNDEFFLLFSYIENFFYFDKCDSKSEIFGGNFQTLVPIETHPLKMIKIGAEGRFCCQKFIWRFRYPMFDY